MRPARLNTRGIRYCRCPRIRAKSTPKSSDGARLGYGLAASKELTMRDIAALSDVFYIGGTKVGALFGEAVVFTKKNMPPHFMTQVKQHGGLLAKGWLLGLQFDTLLTDDLYLQISRHAVDLAMKLREGLRRKGYQLLLESPTNQQFVVLQNHQMRALAEKVIFSEWEPVDENRTAIRLATSWAIREEDVDALLDLL